MRISTIVAYDKNRAIGHSGNLPWEIKDDFENYKKITEGHCLIMGRKTYESNTQPIAGRTNIVITSNREYEVPKGTYVRHSVEDGIKLALELGDDECFINGGGEIYKAGMSHVTKAYITQVHCEINGADSFFPDVDFSTWENEDGFVHEKDERNQYKWEFKVYTRLLS